MDNTTRKSIILLLLTILILISQQINSQETFDPPLKPLEIKALKIQDGIIKLDGNLDENVWKKTTYVKGFTQREPKQSAPASLDTEVRIVFDSKYLYIGAKCFDIIPDLNALRIQNLQRDFNHFDNDRFSVAIDGLLDKRNSVGFEVTPYGSQRELQVIDGNEWDGNVDWNALWYARTKITSDAWFVEMAIPWKTLRYKNGTEQFNISFSRNIRRLNEVNTWPSIPRAFSHYRMAYAGVLKGLQTPVPSSNIQLNPYVVVNDKNSRDNNDVSQNESELEIGGEFKWAVTPNTVLDVTINTDFAQAEVDQQVQNLSRFSVLFPERRQFFLENANVFRTAQVDNIQPFFSRQIGLDNSGAPIPIEWGLRMTSSTEKQTSGLLLMRQGEELNNPATTFGVGRYVHNFSGQNRIGGLVTHRQANSFVSDRKEQISNTTGTINGFFRPNQSVSFDAMVSYSNDSEKGNGLAAHAWLYQQKNWGYIGVIGQYVSENYLPGMGFLAFRDYMLLSPSMDLDFRPKWLPKFIRRYAPDLRSEILWSASNGSFLQSVLDFSPIDLEFESGGQIEIRVNKEWQNLEQSFYPLGIEIGSGRYEYEQFEFKYNTDFSKRLAFNAMFRTGTYYNGNINRYDLDIRIAPIPQIEIFSSYGINQLSNLGIDGTDVDAKLWSITSRLALNPRVRLDGFYQRNSINNANIWNVRFTWEYRPLSFIYLVFNNNEFDGNINQMLPISQREIIGKITFLKQF